jgi:hypothetical protein
VESRLRLGRDMRAHFLVLLAAPLYAQSLSIGGKIGVPLGDAMSRYGESRPYMLGPTIEVRLPAGFAIEGSAIYRRLGQTNAFVYSPEPGSSANWVNRVRGNAWEFPLIGKYYFGERASAWQPYIGTGWSLRTVGWRYRGSTTTTDAAGTRSVVPFENEDRSALGVGAAVVAGIRVRVGRISLLPEFRFTRWGQDYSPGRRNEGGFFLGFRF